MASDLIQALTCIACGRPDERPEMITAQLPNVAPGWPTSITLCRACAFAIAGACASSGESPPASQIDAGDVAKAEDPPYEAKCFRARCLKPVVYFCSKHDAWGCERHSYEHRNCDPAGDLDPNAQAGENSSN